MGEGKGEGEIVTRKVPPLYPLPQRGGDLNWVGNFYLYFRA